MSYILVAKLINTNSETLYRVLDNNTLKTVDITEKRLLSTQAEYSNIRKSANGKKIVGITTAYKPTVIRDGVVEEEYYTLVSIDTKKNEVVLVDYEGNKKVITIEDYIDTRKNKINNESVRFNTNQRFISLDKYGGKAGERLELPIEDIEDSNSIENEQSKEIDCTQPAKDETVEIKGETNQIDKSDNILKDIVFNMYPTDRITISLDNYYMFENVILRILDSNMSNTLTLTLCKLYKTSDKSKFTLAYVKTDLEEQTVNIQVIGQSDIDGKLIKDDIEKICQSYAVWLKQEKFTRI